MVEFALVLIVLLALMLGVLDTSRAAVAAASVSTVAREAARYGAVHVRDASYATAAQAQGLTYAHALDASQLTLTVTETTVGARIYVTATATYTFRPAVPFIGNLAGSFPIQASARMLAH